MAPSIEKLNAHDEAEPTLIGLLGEPRRRPSAPREPMATVPDAAEALERHDTIPAPPPAWADETE